MTIISNRKIKIVDAERWKIMLLVEGDDQE